MRFLLSQRILNGITEEYKKRLISYKQRSITRAATILDPRFKAKGFCSTINYGEAKRCVISYVH